MVVSKRSEWLLNAVALSWNSAVLLYTTDLETIMTPPANKLMILSSLVPKQIIDEGLADWHSAGGGQQFPVPETVLKTHMLMILNGNYLSILSITSSNMVKYKLWVMEFSQDIANYYHCFSVMAKCYVTPEAENLLAWTVTFSFHQQSRRLSCIIAANPAQPPSITQVNTPAPFMWRFTTASFCNLYCWCMLFRHMYGH